MATAQTPIAKATPFPWYRVMPGLFAAVHWALEGLRWNMSKAMNQPLPVISELGSPLGVVRLLLVGFAAWSLYSWYTEQPPATPAPATAAPIDWTSWLLPLSLVAMTIMFAVVFVHDDPTANLTQFLLASGGAAVLGWGYALTQKGRSKDFQVLRDRLLLALGIGGALAYTNFGHLHFGNFIHVWDTYHYYMGAKYFPEVQYDLLYDCAAVADSESGLREVAAARTITDLRTNVMLKAADVVAHPEVCKNSFSPQRWEDFKHDIAFFRGKVNSIRWMEIHQDHGYNATPVWTLAGWLLTNTGPATQSQVVTLNLIDPLYLALMALMIYWAFGPRVFAVSMLVLGCNFPARYYWTGGAFLRHDWIFYTVAVVCLLRKEKFLLAGLALSYATLLRLFPGLMVIGPLLAGIELLRVNRKLDPGFVKFVAGGALGCALLIPASLQLGGGLQTWGKFIQNTSKHANTPLTNHMGLRTVVSYRPDTRGSWLRDGAAIDPWQKWKDTRVKKFHEAQPLFILLLIGLAALIYLAVRQTKGALWIAAAMGTGYIVAGAELTCYYYCFFVGMACLHELKREVGLVLMVMLASTQVIASAIGGLSGMLDDQYTTMTIAALAACISVWFLFSKEGDALSIAPELPVTNLWPQAVLATGPAAAADKKPRKKR